MSELEDFLNFARDRLAETDEPLPCEPVAAAACAYYCGQFEVSSIRPVSGPVYQYEINSAYPINNRKLQPKE
jgi:hypothetical protein